MNTQEFINLAIDKIVEQNTDLGILRSELEMTWYNHTIENKKALFAVITEYDSKDRYFEVTYCHAENSLTIDEYVANSKTKLQV